MRRLSLSGQLNEDTMLTIMMEQKKPVRNDIALSGTRLRKYFPKYYSSAQIEEAIFKLLDTWFTQKQNKAKK